MRDLWNKKVCDEVVSGGSPTEEGLKTYRKLGENLIRAAIKDWRLKEDNSIQS